MNINYNYFSDQNEVMKAAVKKLNYVLKQAAKDSNINYLFLMSGGSSTGLLTYVDEKNLNSKLTVCPLDERNDSTGCNFVKVKETGFIKKAIDSGCAVINSEYQNGETLEQLASRLNLELANWLNNNPDGKIIATIGVGADGHVAGIMPFKENDNHTKLFFEGKKQNAYVVGYDAKEKNPYPLRVTVTFNILRRIQTVITYAIDKQKPIKMLFNKNGKLAEAPIRILREIKNVYLFTNTAKPKS